MEGNQNVAPDSHNSSGESAVEDLKLLIDCIKYQTDDLGYQEQALKTMASICHTNDNALDYLVHSDGLQYIMKIIFNTTISNSLKVECLHVLCVTCENNALAQQMLCEETIFMVIKKFLTMKSNPVLQTLSSYLLICLVTNNDSMQKAVNDVIDIFTRKGQVLARTTRCLEVLRYLFKDVRSPLCSPRDRNGTPGFQIADQPEGQEDLINLWQTATSALTACVNNPQNNENQVFCSSAFPAAVVYLRNSRSSIIQATTLSFITNCLANNKRTQISFRLVGGLRVLSEVLRAELGTDDQLPSKTLHNLVLALGTAVCGNKICRDSAAEIEIIPLLLQCTQLSFATPMFKVECLITIASCIEECVPNCLAFSAHDGVAIVIEMLAQYQNCEELKKSATCVLHSYMKETKSLDASSLEIVLSSKLIHDGSSSATACRQSNEQPYLEHISQIAKLHDTCNSSTLSTNLVEPRRECDAVNKANDGVVTTSTPLSASASDGIVKNQIKYLTEEVQFLKQLFTNKENIRHASTVKDVQQSLRDIINAVCNTKVLAVPQSDIQNEEQLHINNDTTTGKMTSLNFNNHTSTEEKQSPVPFNTTVEEINHTTTASHVKDTTTTIMMESDLNSSTANELGKSHLGNHTNATAMQHTATTADMEQSHLGNHTNATAMQHTATTADMEQSHFTNKTATICCGQCGNQCSHQIINKTCVTDTAKFTSSSFSQSENGSLNNATESMAASIKLRKIRPNGQRLENIEADNIIRSTVSDKHSSQPSRVQEHSQNGEMSGKLSQIAFQGSLVQSDMALTTPLVKEKDSSYMSSPTVHILDNENEISDPASEISDVGDESYVPSTEYEENVDATNVINIRYGVTPDKETTPTVPNTKRPSKTSSAMINKSRNNSSKKTLHMTLKKKKRSALDNVIELSSDESMVHISLSSSLSSLPQDSGDEKSREISTKTPIKSSKINNIGPLQAKRREKDISSKCLGCCGDFNKLNSRNFLPLLRSSSHTCSRHRDFVKQISSALRRYKNISKRKQRSPKFDFIPSPKLNARREKSPAVILRSVMPKQKDSRSSKVPFSRMEIEVLKKGYAKYGPRWSVIEKYCQFSVKRTACTLKQKFKSLSKSVIKTNRIRFSSQEERNLKHGISKLGYSWRRILDRYSFHEARTPQNLKDKWRNLIKYTQ